MMENCLRVDLLQLGVPPGTDVCASNGRKRFAGQQRALPFAHYALVLPRAHFGWHYFCEVPLQRLMRNGAVGLNSALLKTSSADVGFYLSSPRKSTGLGLERRPGGDRFSACSRLPLALAGRMMLAIVFSVSARRGGVSQICPI
jgi:hypothetical protein